MSATKELVYWLRLVNTKGLSPNKIKSLITHFGNARSICEASPHSLKPFGLENVVIHSLRSDSKAETIDQTLAWLEHPSHHMVVFTDDLYPSLLKCIDSPPPLLYVAGAVELLSEPQLAIVGSRNPSENGRQTAFEFAKFLSGSGLIITSGLALGIDAACHEGAIAANGPTIAVMATGIEQIYPAKHKTLAKKIIEKNGAIVTEFPFGTQPRPPLFPQRNRIISGLSMGTLVVEAAIRSGSLITARHAVDQAREVFAIPGSIHNPLARGCHKLIQQGAKLVENAQDIIEELAPKLRLALEQTEHPKVNEEVDINGPNQALDPDYQLILQKMGYEAISVDELITRSRLPAEAVASMLMILELRGIIAQNSDGRYSKRTNMA